jgi:putative ABC transport system permease protein
LGASTPQLVSILSKELLILIAIANLIAWPLAYWTMDQWLQNFAYHTKLSLWIFLFAGVLAALIAGSISGYQAVKAARANPVDALRYE